MHNRSQYISKCIMFGYLRPQIYFTYGNKVRLFVISYIKYKSRLYECSVQQTQKIEVHLGHTNTIIW